MAKTARKAAMGIIAMMAVGGGSATASNVSDAIVVRVINVAGVRPPELDRAKALATAVYEKVGVVVTWIGANEGIPDGFENALHLRVSLLSDEVTATVLRNQRISPTVLGVAPSDTTAVYIFTGRVEAKAAAAGRSFDHILGRVLTHEIGHQLLPRQGHSSSGIMRAHLDMSERVVAGFTSEQVVSIRARLMAAR